MTIKQISKFLQQEGIEVLDANEAAYHLCEYVFTNIEDLKVLIKLINKLEEEC